MQREDFTFDSRDGHTKIHAVRWIPDGEVKYILQIIHGMAEYMERYEHMARWLCDRGVLVTGEDHLGHGATVPEGGTYGYFAPDDPATIVVRDVHRLKKMTQSLYPDVPYYMMGHSMGSFIIRNYMFKYGTGIKGAIVCGTATHPPIEVKMGMLLANIQKLFLGDKHVAMMLNNMSLGTSSKTPYEERFEWLCCDRDVINRYIEDPLCGFCFTVNGFRTLFTLLDRQNKMKNLEKMPKELPVMIIAGSEDPVGNCGKGEIYVKNQYEKLGMKDVFFKLYDGLKHEIFNEKEKEMVFEDIYSWITKER